MGDPLHALQLDLALGQKLGAGGLVARCRSLQEIVEGPEGRDGRAQLVGGIGDEAAEGVAFGRQLAKARFQAPGHAVELRGQLPDFVLATDGGAGGQVPLAHPAGDPGQVAEGGGQPAAHEEAHDDGHEHGDRRRVEEGPARRRQGLGGKVGALADLYVAQRRLTGADGFADHQIGTGCSLGFAGQLLQVLNVVDDVQLEPAAPGAFLPTQEGHGCFRGKLFKDELLLAGGGRQGQRLSERKLGVDELGNALRQG